MRTDGQTWRSFSCAETDSDLFIQTEMFVVKAESFLSRNTIYLPKQRWPPQLSLCVSPMTFPLLNTIFISEYESFKDSYLVFSASNPPSSVSRRSLQVLWVYSTSYVRRVSFVLFNPILCPFPHLPLVTMTVSLYYAWLWDWKTASVVSAKPKIRYLKRKQIAGMQYKKLIYNLECNAECRELGYGQGFQWGAAIAQSV